MTELNECPICMDIIGEKNCLTTECGHKFHTNCMFTNIDHNGFSCPCCRAQMIATTEDNDSESSTMPELVDDDTSTDYDSSVDESIDDETGPFSEDSLRGLRLLTNLLEGHEHDQADVVAEYNYVNEPEEFMDYIVPPREIIQQKLIEKGVTYEQLVAWILVDHEGYTNQEDELNSVSGDLFEKIREIIAEYKPELEEEEEKEEEFDEDFIQPFHNENEENNTLLSIRKECIEDNDLSLKKLSIDLTNLDDDFDYSAQPKISICV